MSVVVRFAPSPTGALHIGGARTALFNWLFARHHGGQFLLRVEDTDRERSTPENTAIILDGMRWLGMDWDNATNPDYQGRGYYSQFENKDRHSAVAKEMVASGAAYYCYASPEELTAMREEQKEKKLPQRYDGRWRDRDPSEAPAGVSPVVRLKAPLDGATTIRDHVMGTMTVQNDQLDDMILLRSDGTPTYMLAVVVDDHDMGVTHVIRGNDHMTNSYRQTQIYQAMGWDVPEFAHLPLIMGPDGAKLSKRHGAAAVGDYRAMGYLPEALNNYILRLCWSHGDDELIPMAQAIEWFDLDGVGKSPARFDFKKLASVNAHYIQQADNARLATLTMPFLEPLVGRAMTAEDAQVLEKAMPDLKTRAQTLIELAEGAAFYFMARPLVLNDKAQGILSDEARAILGELKPQIEALSEFTSEALESLFKAYADERELKLGKVAQPLRAALSGSNVSPPIFAVAEILGRDETLARLGDVL